MAANQTGLADFGVAPAAEATAPADGRDSGLSAELAARRLAEEGPNALPGGQRRSLLSIAADTVREPMFLLVSADGVTADESLLTGEAVPVGKRVAQPEELAAAEKPAGSARVAPGGDDRPTVYAGTLIVQGHALARITATGERSEIGRIGKALGTVENERSPLQKQTAILVRNLALLALALSLLLVLVHGLIKGDWLQALLAGIALAMAMLPEEYPVVLTVFPALGARRLAKEGVLTRRINAIETLGATTVLCSDKTGTLTENRMTVTHLAAGGVELMDRLALDTLAESPLPEAFHGLVEVAILASVVDPFDPMEKAFHQLGQRFLADTEHLHRDWRLVQTYALSPALRAMSHVWAAAGDGPQTVAGKGSPEAVMDLCHLDDAQRARVAAVVDELAASGLRVLAAARGSFTGADWPANEHDFDFEFIGLLGLADPVRPQVPAAVAECRAATRRCASAWPRSVSAPASHPSRSCASCRP
jgi:Ca2+-transporting ATPase